MLTILLFVINIGTTVLSIYLFDYRIDGIINNPITIILSFVAGMIVTLFFLGIFLELFYLSLSKKKQERSMLAHKISKQIVSVPIHLSNMRIKVIGKENLPNNSGFSIYANHSSWIDLPILMYKLYDHPVAALGKEDAFNIPVIGKFAPKFKCVMIDRDNPRQGAQAIKQVISNIKNGLSMIIFPEGTRNKNVDSVLDFKPGAFKVALRSEKPLVPMTLIKPKNIRNIKWPFKKNIILVIHKPLEFDDFKSMKTIELSQKVKGIIESSLK